MKTMKINGMIDRVAPIERPAVEKMLNTKFEVMEKLYKEMGEPRLGADLYMELEQMALQNMLFVNQNKNTHPSGE